MPRDPEYLTIARTLRTELLAGSYDDEGAIPGNAALAERFGVNFKTAGRAVQHLISERLLIARRGQRPVVVPPEQRLTAWPMTRRYARARAVDGLVFASDVVGDISKVTVEKEWRPAIPLVAPFLGVEVDDRVFARHSRTLISGVVVEETWMHFPPDVVERVPKLESEDDIQVVRLLEEAGYAVTRTRNELRARVATADEQSLFQVAPGSVVFEQIHGTYGAADESLEAVINVRPAATNVVTFDTYEGTSLPSSEG